MRKWRRGDRAVHHIAVTGKLQRRWGTVTSPGFEGVVEFLPDNNGWEKPYQVAAVHLRRLVRRKKAE